MSSAPRPLTPTAQTSSANTNAAEPRPSLPEESFRRCNLTIEEMKALPEDQRDDWAKRLGIISWDPVTISATSTPGDVYAHVSHMEDLLDRLGPLPDLIDNIDETSQGKNIGSGGKA